MNQVDELQELGGLTVEAIVEGLRTVSLTPMTTVPLVEFLILRMCFQGTQCKDEGYRERLANMRRGMSVEQVKALSERWNVVYNR